MFPSRVIHNTARAGDSVTDEGHGSGFIISRAPSKRNALVRCVAGPKYHPAAAGETIVEDLVHDIKTDLQRLQGASQQKTSLTDSHRPSTSQDKTPSRKGSDEHSSSTTPNASPERESSLPYPRQFSILSPDPKHTTKEQVLRLVLRRARMTRAQYFGDFSNFSAEDAIVILVTPAFAKWLEDESFIKGLLERLTYHHGEGKTSYAVVVGAVVDALAPSPNDIPRAERTGPLEGLSFMHGSRTQVLTSKSVWKPESFKTNATNPDKLAHLILSGKPRFKQSEQALATTISLPLANTLFVNGKHSTLEVSQWSRRGGCEYKRIRHVEKQYQHIKAFHHESTMVPPIFVPAVPLSLPRPIANGLGNIVRQLAFGPEDTDNRPASSELETQVTRYMEYSKLHTNIGVWALIYRKGILDPNLKATTLEATENLESIWGNDDENLRFVGTQLALGAILCRVVSGGGGWGAKQGLLSLDPQVTYEDISPATFEHTPYSIEHGQGTTLGNLARRGDYIQFFTINPDKLKDYDSLMKDSASAEVSDLDSSASDEEPAVENWSKRSVFGVVPSTIDKLPTSEVSGESTALANTAPFLTFRKGEFGAVSESGIYLHSSHQRRVNDTSYEHINTKIDMPYSYLYREQPGTSHIETIEYKLKRSLGPRGPRDADGIASPRRVASVFKAINGRFPTREEEAFRLFEERRELFFKAQGYKPYPEEAEKLRLAAEKSKLSFSTPPLTKIRVGHTQWPRFSGEKERPLPIRRVKAKFAELRLTFYNPAEKREETSPSS
ncbi:hypothetical protein DID88_007597 [Monilinia fructigena]|uniref:Uncharacterized protein n=1 Tax=Monilinia fructigena TaxID=38457 RepID=A0A395J3W9_9HELO|nr:hypothetical protein DID88_007597 [Monilinia fructigena]